MATLAVPPTTSVPAPPVLLALDHAAVAWRCSLREIDRRWAADTGCRIGTLNRLRSRAGISGRMNEDTADAIITWLGDAGLPPTTERRCLKCQCRLRAGNRDPRCSPCRGGRA